MKKNINNNHCKGVGLVEVIVTIVILLTVVTGTMAYQYFTALDARKSDLNITAGRLAIIFLETWKGQGSGDDFDPVDEFNLDLDISSSTSNQPAAELTDLLGSYSVTSNNANFFITLSFQDIADSPRLLNIVVAWGQGDYGQGDFSDTDKSISWTSYQGY